MNPSVALTQPAAGGYFVAGSQLLVAADAQTQSPDTVSSVAFYDGSSLLATVTAAPYQTTISNLAAGQHSLSATVTDSGNNTAQSGASLITAVPFRTDFTEFANTTIFPDSTLNYWLNVAAMMLKPSRWGAMLTVGLELFVAHNAVLEAFAVRGVAVGGVPGLSKGAVSAESVDKGALSYDTASTLELDGGNWNLTVYGSRFIRLARMMGAGPMQIGIGYDPNPLGGFAWQGPDVFPGFSNFD